MGGGRNEAGSCQGENAETWGKLSRVAAAEGCRMQTMAWRNQGERLRLTKHCGQAAGMGERGKGVSGERTETRVAPDGNTRGDPGAGQRRQVLSKGKDVTGTAPKWGSE